MKTAELKRRLEEERARLTHELTALADEEVASSERGHSYATHAADDATVTFDQERTVALAVHTAALLKQVEHALHKMDEGSYGHCDDCGQEIAEERIDALPQVTLCMACTTTLRGRP